MAMNRNPYAVYGKCQRCARKPAVWKCQYRGESERQLCDQCADHFHMEVQRKLAERGIQPVGA